MCVCVCEGEREREKEKHHTRIPHSHRQERDSLSYPNRCALTNNRKTPQRGGHTKKQKNQHSCSSCCKKKRKGNGVMLLKPTEIEASVFTDKLQRIHQLSPTQRLRRGHFHRVERQGQCEQQRTTGRRHLLDLHTGNTRRSDKSNMFSVIKKTHNGSNRVQPARFHESCTWKPVRTFSDDSQMLGVIQL